MQHFLEDTLARESSFLWQIRNSDKTHLDFLFSKFAKNYIYMLKIGTLFNLKKKSNKPLKRYILWTRN